MFWSSRNNQMFTQYPLGHIFSMPLLPVIPLHRQILMWWKVFRKCLQRHATGTVEFVPKEESVRKKWWPVRGKSIKIKTNIYALGLIFTYVVYVI